MVDRLLEHLRVLLLPSLLLLVLTALLLRSPLDVCRDDAAAHHLRGTFRRPLRPAHGPAATRNHASVVSFNQLFLNPNVDDRLAAIRAQRADVVALQELVPPVADAMQRDLKAVYPYQILKPSNNVGGLGVLSRYPLEPATGVDRAAGQWVVLHVGGQTLTVVNVHVHFSGISRVRAQRFGSFSYFRGADTRGRLSQVNALLQAVRQRSGS